MSTNPQLSLLHKGKLMPRRLFCSRAPVALVCLSFCLPGCSERVVQQVSKTAATVKPHDSDASLTLQRDGGAHQVVSALAISPDDANVLVGGHGGVKVYAVSNFKQISETKTDLKDAHVGSCDYLVISPDGKTFVAGGDSEWEVTTGLYVPRPLPPTPQLFSFDWRSLRDAPAHRRSPSGERKLVITEVTSPTKRVLEVRDIAPPGALRYELIAPTEYGEFGLSPDGKWIVTVNGKPAGYGGGGGFKIWDSLTGQLAVEKDLGKRVECFAFTSGGEFLFTGQGFDVTKWTFAALLER